MDRLKQDLTVALRRLRSSPGFTLAAIVTLALGIGANTAIFTAVNAVVFQTLPVDHPEELFAVNSLTLTTGRPSSVAESAREPAPVAATHATWSSFSPYTSTSLPSAPAAAATGSLASIVTTW